MANLKIESIWLDDARCDENGMGIGLTVDLNNGSSIIVSLDSKANEPLFHDVVMNKCGKPETDGEHIYWQNGASLSIQDIVAMFQTEKRG
jgi:hypothetical protein